MAESIIIPKPAQQEAQEFVAAASRKIAGMLTHSIANLGYPVGMGVAPHPDSCAAAGAKIAEIFGGAVLAAIEGERDTATLRTALKQAVTHIDHMANWIALTNRGEAKGIYSFESLSEDIGSIRAPLGSPTH